MDSLMQLTRFQDRLSYLYLEKGHIEQDAKSVAYVTEKKQQPALLLGIALGISFNMGKNSIFFWEWNPECLDSHWKNRLFKN